MPLKVILPPYLLVLTTFNDYLKCLLYFSPRIEEQDRILFNTVGGLQVCPRFLPKRAIKLVNLVENLSQRPTQQLDQVQAQLPGPRTGEIRRENN